MEKIEHLADFLGAEKRRRWDEFHDTKLMNCWYCLEVIDKLAEVYDLHWNKETGGFEEEIELTILEAER